MKQKLRRFMAGFLAILTMFTTLFTNGTTAFAASLSANIAFWVASSKDYGVISEFNSLGIGSILVLVGVILRYVAKKQLQSNFTQSVQILDGHRLIRDGIYSKVRHPAYIGTFFIVLGAVFIYGNIVMFVLLLLILPLGIKRINYEEALLLKKFGKEYTEYKQQVNRFIPKTNI